MAVTVEKDFADLHVAKFDCSVFKPICDGIGIVDYPSLVWMKKGQIVEVYEGKKDVESLKTYVFERMQPIKISTEAKTKKLTLGSSAVEAVTSKRSTKRTITETSTLTTLQTQSMSEAQSTKEYVLILPIKNKTESSDDYHSSETKKPVGKSKSIILKETTNDDGDDEEDEDDEEENEESAEDSGQKIDLLGVAQESSESSNSTEMEEIVSLDESEEVSTESESYSPTTALKKGVKIVKSSRYKSNLLELSAANYTESLNPEGTSLIMMYAPWCNFCDEMRKKLKLVAFKHEKSSLITIGEINCVNKDNEELCFAEKMQGIPTFNVYRKKNLLLNDYKGKTFQELDDILSDQGIEKWKKQEANRLKTGEGKKSKN